MKTLTKELQKIKKNKKGIFIPYIMAGDHEKGLDGLEETIQFLEKQGVSAIEIGVPFSDPVADGPIIEAAGIRSLKKKTTLSDIILKLKTISSTVPLILMTYFNPLYQYGIENVVSELRETPVKGLIIPDLPYEHFDFIMPFLTNTDLALIPLVSLTTGKERQQMLCQEAEGFIYAVAVNGVTGNSQSYRSDLDHHLNELQQLVSIPVLTGFGVASTDDIERFNAVSDGVIVGSKIVNALYHQDKDSIADFIYLGSHFSKE